jgi:hypothetical protein
LFRCDSLMVRGSRPTVGDSGEGGCPACGDCDSEVVLEEEGRGCDDCDSRSSILGGEAGNLDGSCDIIRCQSWNRDSTTQREK